jgi:putative transposase
MPNSPGRRSVRLKHFNYASPGYYYVTLCCADKRSIFGVVRDGVVVLSEYGEIALKHLLTSIAIRAKLELDSYVIMSSHIHLVVQLCGASAKESWQIKQAGALPVRSISSFVAGYKSAVTSEIRKQADPDFQVWHRGYHEHVIRTEEALQAMRRYIADNPLQWEPDYYNPQRLAGAEDSIHAVLQADGKIPLR